MKHLLTVVCCVLFCLTAVRAEALDFSADLEVGIESRWIGFETEQSSLNSAHELGVNLGLGWNPVAFVTVHGRFEASWMALLDERVSYRYRNQSMTAAHLWNIGLNGSVDIHPASRIVSGAIELSARSYFAPGRAGLFLVQAGVGVGAQPFVELRSTLRTVRFGVICRFHVYDDFRDIFSLERKRPEVALQVMWGF